MLTETILYILIFALIGFGGLALWVIYSANKNSQDKQNQLDEAHYANQKGSKATKVVAEDIINRKPDSGITALRWLREQINNRK
jgi:predicted negative regulator of RcsB-dependent stress response